MPAGARVDYPLVAPLTFVENQGDIGSAFFSALLIRLALIFVRTDLTALIAAPILFLTIRILRFLASLRHKCDTFALVSIRWSRARVMS